MLVGLTSNAEKDKNFDVAKCVVSALEKNNLNFVADSQIASVLGLSYPSGENVLYEKTDMLIVIGGDGTIIRVAKNAVSHNLPILGINKGRLGFLAEAEIADIDKIIGLIKNKKFSIEKRSLLSVSFNGKSFTALNEVLLHRTQDSRIIAFKVYIDGAFADGFSADGFIVSTPTGSTAYSLSAGGPILSPNIQGFVINSICSHNLHTRPIVVCDKDIISVRTQIRKSDKVCVTVDGYAVEILSDNAEFRFEKSAGSVQFIRTAPTNFYSRLLSKLNVHVK